MNEVEDVYILGIGASETGRLPDTPFTEIAGKALREAFADANFTDAAPIDNVWFSSFMMDLWGQSSGQGNEVLGPLRDAGLLANGVAIADVEAACARASVAFNSAVRFVQSRSGEVALAVGVEKMNPVGLSKKEARRSSPQASRRRRVTWIRSVSTMTMTNWPASAGRRSNRSTTGRLRWTSMLCGHSTTCRRTARNLNRSPLLRRRTTQTPQEILVPSTASP